MLCRLASIGARVGRDGAYGLGPRRPLCDQQAAEERKRKRAVRVRYVPERRQRTVTGEALARLMTVGQVLMDRVSDGREWRDNSLRVQEKRPRRKVGKGDG